MSAAQADEVAQVEMYVMGILGGDTAAVSAAQCLNLFLARLGMRRLGREAAAALAGGAPALLREALAGREFLNCRPSVIAAAVVYADRRARGIIPFWPSVLAKMTRYQDMSSHELNHALKARSHASTKPIAAALHS